jgi:hypothetical protein
MCTVRLYELTSILEVSAQAGQSGAVNKTSLESTAEDDYQEVKRHTRPISNDTSQRAKRSTKPVPTFAAVKLSPKTLITRKFFAPVRTTDTDKETTGARGSQKIW